MIEFLCPLFIIFPLSKKPAVDQTEGGRAGYQRDDVQLEPLHGDEGDDRDSHGEPINASTSRGKDIDTEPDGQVENTPLQFIATLAPEKLCQNNMR